MRKLPEPEYRPGHVGRLVPRELPRPEYRPGGMRCVADTPHKMFNRQADYIGTGNVFSNIQTSSFVHAHNVTAINGLDVFVPGYLRSFDLRLFGEMPKRFWEAVLRETQDKSVILYQFHHYLDRRRMVHGYLITDPKTHDMLDFAVTGTNWKSAHVFKWCAQYVSFPYREGEEPPAG